MFNRPATRSTSYVEVEEIALRKSVRFYWSSPFNHSRDMCTQHANADHTDFRFLNMAENEETQVVVPLIEDQDMAVIPVQTSERRLSAVVSVNNQQLLVVG
jgi:hypothetical protein